MDGYDVQTWLTCIEKINMNELTYELHGEFIHIKDKNKLMLGSFKSVEDLFSYLCGYETGLSKGVIIGLNKSKKKLSK